MAQEEVLVAVAGKVADDGAQRGGPLGLSRERDGPVRAVALRDESRVGQGGDMDLLGLGIGRPQDFLHTGAGVARGGGHALARIGQGQVEPEMALEERDLDGALGIGLGLEEIERPRAVEVAVVQPPGRLRRRPPGGVLPPTGGHEFQLTVGIEVGRGEPPPAARIRREARRRGAVAQAALCVMEQAHRAPVGRQDQLGEAVLVEIGKERGTDQPHRIQYGLVERVAHPPLRHLEIEHRRGRDRIRGGDHPAANKEIEVAIAVDVAEGQGAHTGERAGMNDGGGARRAVHRAHLHHRAPRGGGRGFVRLLGEEQ